MNDTKRFEGAPAEPRFLLIKPWGAGFWSDMEDVQSKLLLAEITHRHPVVFWEIDSLYYVGENINAFEQFFFPVSEYSIDDVICEQYTYYPPTWNHLNVSKRDPNKMTWAYRDVPDYFQCEANVLVSDTYRPMYQIMSWLKEDHPIYGLSEDDAYRYIYHKYLKLQPDITAEIDQFYHTHMQTQPILAVHIRGGAKKNEVPQLPEINNRYPQEINYYLQNHPSARIFLLTDDETILEQYKQMYGDQLVYTDCTRRTGNEVDISWKYFPDQRRKGIEIIKDTYLACKCDHFIGNYYSNVSMAIKRLKVWEEGTIKLFT